MNSANEEERIVSTTDVMRQQRTGTTSEDLCVSSARTARQSANTRMKKVGGYSQSTRYNETSFVRIEKEMQTLLLSAHS